MTEEIKLLNEIIATQEAALNEADKVINACFKEIELLKEKIAALEGNQ